MTEYPTMKDFWTNRGLVDTSETNIGQEAAAALPRAAPVVTDLPFDYAARVRAVELAVHMTMSKFDGGQERVMQRARGFHAFMIGRRPYELTLSPEAYEAAAKAVNDQFYEMTPESALEIAEAAVDAAWDVIINQKDV